MGITSKDIIDWKDLHKGSGYKEIGKEGLNELQESVQKKLANKIDIEEHISNVENLKPITRWDTVPEIPTFKDIAFSLRAQAGKLFKDSKYDKVGRGTILYKNKSIEDGIITTSRLDIPAYQDFDKWVVTLGPKGSNNVYAKTGYFKGGQGGRVQFNPRTHLATQVGIGKKPKNPDDVIEESEILIDIINKRGSNKNRSNYILLHDVSKANNSYYVVWMIKKDNLNSILDLDRKNYQMMVKL